MIKILKENIRLIKRLNNGNNLNKEESICRETLHTYITYRLPASAQKDILTPFRMLSRVFKKISNKQEAFIKLNSFPSAVLGLSPKNKEDVVHHLEIQSKEPIGFFIVKDFLSAELSNKENAVVKRQMIFFTLSIFLKCLFSNNRQRLSMQILHVYESAALIDGLQKNNITTLYDFAGFHIDSNYLTYLLQKKNIKVVKSPSPGPLEIHYKHLITDTICYSNPYQLEELIRFEKTNSFKEMVKWKPQMSHLYRSDYFVDGIESTNKKTIGFYSHGEWIRRDLGHSDVGKGTLETEEFILNCLGQFLKNNSECELIIYPHPIEKRDEHIQQTINHYKDILEDVNYTLVQSGTKTVDDFDKINLAVVAYSNLINERLYCGFKLLIGMLPNNKLFHSESKLNNLCFYSKEEFEELFNSNFTLSNEVFFEKNELTEFHHKSY